MRSSLYDACHAAGGMTAYEWDRDPKRLLFILARYKFVAKMLQGVNSALEIGCADGFGSRVVRQHVKNLDAIDKDEPSIVAAKAGMSPQWPINFRAVDFVNMEVKLGYAAVYALDVLEHVDPLTEEQQFLECMRAQSNVAIIGMPSLESQQHASELSKLGHINCKTGPQLRATLQRHWSNVFLFGMNDEVLHTGFEPMAQYRFALGVG